VICDAIDNSVPAVPVDPNVYDFITAATTAGEVSAMQKLQPRPLPLSPVLSRPTVSAVNFKPEDYVAFQMSLVPEVEQVFVSHPSRGELQVLIVVNDRDRILNRKIFAKEKAIVDYYRHLRFDFHIVPRMNRSLNDIMAVRGTRVLPATLQLGLCG
jgi:hypothetical protein